MPLMSCGHTKYQDNAKVSAQLIHSSGSIYMCTLDLFFHNIFKIDLISDLFFHTCTSNAFKIDLIFVLAHKMLIY